MRLYSPLLFLCALLLASCQSAQTQSVVVTPPLATCTEAQIAVANALTGAYTPSALDEFARVEQGGLWVGDAPYRVRGVNYYPSRYPWRRFLTGTDDVTLQTEFDLLQNAGLNTLRIFLWNEALFQCFGNGAVPRPDAFQRLDRVVQLAAEHGLYLLITLNDLPDLESYPLYSNPAHVLAQTAFIVSRYRDEAAILAWDIRNEGDIDYGTLSSVPARFSREQVLNWGQATSEAIRALDSNHLITAGWLHDAGSTAPFVDFISFHHWTDAGDLVRRVGEIRAATDKPILLEEVGYSTQRMSEMEQANTFAQLFEASERENLLGWLVWTAFDFPLDRSCYPTPCLSPDNAEHYFGLWRVDYTPKPAAAILEEN